MREARRAYGLQERLPCRRLEAYLRRAARASRVRRPWGHPYGVRAASRPPICRAPWKGRGDIRRAAVRGLGTFTWGFLRHSPASVLARGKNRGDARIVSVGEAVLWPCCVRQAREIISVCL